MLIVVLNSGSGSLTTIAVNGRKKHTPYTPSALRIWQMVRILSIWGRGAGSQGQKWQVVFHRGLPRATALGTHCALLTDPQCPLVSSQAICLDNILFPTGAHGGATTCTSGECGWHVFSQVRVSVIFPHSFTGMQKVQREFRLATSAVLDMLGPCLMRAQQDNEVQRWGETKIRQLKVAIRKQRLH